MSVVATSSVDAYISQARDLGTWGDAVRLKLSAQTGDQFRAFVFFPRPFPIGATVHEATLRLHLAGDWSGTRTVTIQRVTGAWKEQRVNWNNKPTTTSTNEASESVASAADGDEAEFDLTDMLGDVAAGGAWYGVQVTISTNSVHRLYSAEAPDVALRPSLEVDWSEPPEAPSGLVPGGADAVSIAEPTLLWQFRDISAGGVQLYSQVQIDATDDFASPEYDTGQVANVNSSWDTSDVGAVQDWSGISAAATKFWRVRVWDDTGLISDWSDAAEFTRDAQGTLTLDNPPDADPSEVEETTPPIAWTLTGATQEAVRVTLWERIITELGAFWSLEPIWEMPRTVTDEDSVTVPEGLIVTGKTYKVELEVWDDVSRASTPGDLAQLRAIREFSYVRNGDPTATTSLSAAVDGHKVTLTWQRSSMPDFFCLVVDGVEVMQRIEATDVFVSGTTYSMEFWRATADESHTYEVEAVVEDGGVFEHSDDNATVAIETDPFGITLVDDTEPQGGVYVVLRGTDGPELAIAESGETFRLMGTRAPVRITDSIGGYEGAVSGILLTHAEKDTLEALKGRGRTLRLAVADINVPVQLGPVSITPQAASETHWQASVELFQVGEFTLDEEGIAAPAPPPPPPPFDPSTIAGLQGWWKADAITGLADNDPVATWEDSHTSNHDLTQGTAGNRPTYQTSEINGLPVVRFDGSNDRLATGAFTLNLPFTVLAVVKPVTGVAYGDMLFDGLQASRSGLMDNDAVSGNRDFQLLCSGYLITGDTTWPVNAWSILSTWIKAAGSPGSSLWRDGTLKDTGNVGTINPGGITLGSKSDGSGAMPMDCAEFLVYDSALSDVDRAAVEEYLMDKYGL